MKKNNSTVLRCKRPVFSPAVYTIDSVVLFVYYGMLFIDFLFYGLL
jgi:hypothetical protein